VGSFFIAFEDNQPVVCGNEQGVVSENEVTARRTPRSQIDRSDDFGRAALRLLAYSLIEHKYRLASWPVYKFTSKYAASVAVRRRFGMPRQAAVRCRELAHEPTRVDIKPVQIVAAGN
jgi:hypothetical protein